MSDFITKADLKDKRFDGLDCEWLHSPITTIGEHVTRQMLLSFITASTDPAEYSKGNGYPDLPISEGHMNRLARAGFITVFSGSYSLKTKIKNDVQRFPVYAISSTRRGLEYIEGVMAFNNL